MTERSCLALCLLLTGLLAAPAGAAGEFPDPPDARIQNVGSDLTVYGMQLQARRFESERSMEQVLDFYRRHWKGRQDSGDKERPGYEEIEVGPWRMITRLTEERLYSVQVQSDGRGSWGYLGETPLSSFAQLDPDEWGSDFPSMRGSQAIGDLAHDDPGRDARTLHLVNDFSVKGNSSYYRKHFRQRGWQTVMDESLGGNEPTAFVFRKGREEISMVIQQRDDGKTHIITNRVEHGLLD